ncbi:MAG: T9SS type A sorting domain-containing protein [Bacteroidetes bacterium]|nr:T9SS type A sorting domain-containing protein [Bacteroidota bacterium]
MKRIVLAAIVAALLLSVAGTCRAGQQSGLPPAGDNKVVYYPFDSGGPDHYPLSTFTDKANIVVIFEGTLWELADSTDYHTGWMTTTNRNYQYYSQILSDVRTLQARGVKVLMNVDDAPSWGTSIPFTTYDGKQLDAAQFAEFMKACAIDSLHLDGISLDIEHGASGNANYIQLLKEIGKYFGPRSSNSSTEMYIAAIYASGRPGYVIGQSKEVSSYFNFVMDMAYFSSNYIGRFNQWADSIGASKVMIGVLNDNNTLAFATEVAKWQPPSGQKAGIMVYAGNNLKSYTDSVFSALDWSLPVPQQFTLEQNYPNPFNPSTTIEFNLAVPSHVILQVYDVLGRLVTTLFDGDEEAGRQQAKFTIVGHASGVYFYRLHVTPMSGRGGAYSKVMKMMLLK